ncbi:MAG: MFS transporter [Bacteroidetes bacterium]|nr:MAG: MFS transporter [Bacteroidota bacterium]
MRSQLQLTAVLICFLMNMLDGMDVMIISYAASSIAAEWSVNAVNLGGVFSAGLLGMAAGAMFLAARADKIGRKALVFISAAWMGICVLLTVAASSVEMLACIRFLSGIGIGSMLASTSTLASEYSEGRSKSFWVSLVMAGYPIGAVLSGLMAAYVIPVWGWRAVFAAASGLTLITLPVIYYLLPESLAFLLRTQPPHALARANALLSRMKKPPLPQLPPQEVVVVRTSVRQIFSAPRRVETLLLWLVFFMSFATLYFLTSWIPKLASEAGLSVELSIYAGTVFNLGAFAGILTQGYFSSKLGLEPVLAFFFFLTAFLMLVFGGISDSILILVFLGLIGFGIQGGFVGLYSVAARLYPTEIRSTGIGWAIGIGRLGAMAGPLLGGLLVTMQLSMAQHFYVFAAPALLAGVAVICISGTNPS